MMGSGYLKPCRRPMSKSGLMLSRLDPLASQDIIRNIEVVHSSLLSYIKIPESQLPIRDGLH